MYRNFDRVLDIAMQDIAMLGRDGHGRPKNEYPRASRRPAGTGTRRRRRITIEQKESLKFERSVEHEQKEFLKFERSPPFLKFVDH